MPLYPYLSPPDHWSGCPSIGIGLTAEHVHMGILSPYPGDHRSIKFVPAKGTIAGNVGQLHLLGIQSDFLPGLFAKRPDHLFHFCASLGFDIIQPAVQFRQIDHLVPVGLRIGPEPTYSISF